MPGILAQAIDSAAKKLKADNPYLVYDPHRPLEVISTGSTMVDRLTGVGGLFVKRRIVEIVGVESCGKTTLCLQSAATAQRVGLKGAMLDYEGAFDHIYASNLGVTLDRDTFDLVQPNTAEEGETVINSLYDYMNAKNGLKLDYLIIDSVAACRPKAFLEKAPDDPTRPGLHAAFWSNHVDKLKRMAQMFNVAIVLVNQVRSRIMNQRDRYNILSTGIGAGFSFVDIMVNSPGGQALRQYAEARYLLAPSGRVRMDAGDSDDEDSGASVGQWNSIKVVKSKLAPVSGRKTKFVINFGTGTDDALPIYEYLKSKKLVDIGGGGIHEFHGLPGWSVEYKVKGKAKFQDWIRQPENLAKFSEHFQVAMSTETNPDAINPSLDASVVDNTYVPNMENLELDEGNATVEDFQELDEEREAKKKSKK